jgi:hypothetical protein
MIELHPEILTKDGKPEFVKLPYDEFMRLREELMASKGGTIVPDPRFGRFWENVGADELSRRQGIGPAKGVEDLYGDGDPADWEGFEDAVMEWRSEHPMT